MDPDEYVAEADECDQQPSGERDKATSPQQKLVSKILQSLTRTNQIGHVKGVSTTHVGKILLMTIPWIGKGEIPHTMRILECRKVSCLYMLMTLIISNASYTKWTWLGHAWYVECIEMNACDIMND